MGLLHYNDLANIYRYNPNFAIFLTSFNIDGGSKIVRFIPVPTIPGDFPDPDDEDGDDGDIGDSGGMPFDGML